MISNKLYQKLFLNTNIFLNAAIYNLNKGFDSHNNRVLAVVSTQMALELAIKTRITKDYGIRIILEGDISSATNEDIWEGYENNSLRIKEFEQLKNFLKSKIDYNKYFTGEYTYMERFQKYRNKLVHFDYNFTEHELEQMESDIIHVIVNILHILISTNVSHDEYRKFMEEYIDSTEYQKLLSNSLYQVALQNIIIREYGETYLCPICSRNLFLPIKKCLGCLSDFNNPSAFGFVNCNYCGKETVIYDACNIEHNLTLRGLCLYCENDAVIYKCPKCGNTLNLENSKEHSCTPDYCSMFD